ncbi:MAG: AMP-binding protein [Phycisphaerales bacterium]|nr:AMP-binding protein [Phycisphaerales bacterium]
MQTSDSRALTDLPCVDSGLIDSLWRHARQRPNAEAVGEVDGARRTCTYRELAGQVAARARRLIGSVAPGQVVIAVLPAGIDYIAWFYASIAAGVKFLPLHTQIAGPEALAISKRVGAVAAIVSPGLAAEPALRHLAMDVCEEARLGRSGPRLSRESAGAVVLGSSGTMGMPKLVLRSSTSLDADAAGVIAGMGLTAGDRVVFATPLSHSYGVDVLVSVVAAGATLRVMSRFDSEVLAQEMEGGATILLGVPFIFEALARRPRRQAVGLRLALSAGSPLSARVRREFIDAWAVQVGQLYGATELGTVAMGVPGSEGFDAESVGRPLTGVSMRVVDLADPQRTLETGQEGQLAVHASSMLSRYLDADLCLVDGHLLTGDLAKIDTEGRVWITGRLKLLIDVGAYKVNPLEVESVICTHPSVAECVVVPLSASETLQRLRAVVVLQESGHAATAEALRQFLRERLSPIKVPRVIEFAASLPKSPTGKVLRDQVIGRTT